MSDYILFTPIHRILKDLKQKITNQIFDLKQQIDTNEFIYNELSNVKSKDYNPTTRDHFETYRDEYLAAGVDLGDLTQPADLYEFKNLLCENINEDLYHQEKELEELENYLAKVA